MGTKWHIALYARNTQSANAAFDGAFALIAEIDADLTNYGRDSELNRLCRSAPHEHPVPVGEHLWTVMQAADRMSQLTDGAFDVTVGPLSKLWRRARKRGTLPDSDRLADAQRGVGHQFVEFHEPRSIQLTRAAMQLDLGGIAKGYAVDQAIRAVVEQGIESVLVNGGGDLGAAAPPPDRQGWLVKLGAERPNLPTRSMWLSHAAVATSGDAFQFVEIDGQRYSHIIDPQTGKGTTHQSTVSVVASTCMQADAWASALSVLDPAKGMSLVDQTDGIEAIQISVRDAQAPQEMKSSGFPELIMVTAQTDTIATLVRIAVGRKRRISIRFADLPPKSTYSLWFAPVGCKPQVR